MNNCPYRVTICSPIYGVEKYIERCAVSLFEQTYGDIDYIFINDSTKDSSIEILKDVILRYPVRKDCVKIINHESNRGLSAARNTGIKNVETDFLIWVDSDDYVAPTMVEVLVNNQIRTNADIVCGGVQSIYKDFVIDEERDVNMSKTVYLHRLLSKKTEHWIWGKLIRRDLYISNKISNVEGINVGEDYQTLPILVNTANRIAFEKQICYYYERSNEASLTSFVSEKKQEEAFESYLYTLNNFKGSIYEKDIKRYLLLLLFEQMKPFIRGKALSKEHRNYYKIKMPRIPLSCYISLPPKQLIGVIISLIMIKFGR